MAKITPNVALADALAAAKSVARENVIKHTELGTKHIAVLKKAGCLSPVIRGWYLLNKPDAAGTSTVWYVGFWPFVKYYLQDRFGKQEYCLSADASIDIYAGEEHIWQQIIVITKKTSNQKVELPSDTSLLLYTDSKNYPKHVVKYNGIYLMSLPLALCRLSPVYFQKKPLNVEIVLKSLPSIAEVSRILLEGGLVTDAGRIAGALRAIGDNKKADQIVSDMQAAGFVINENNPFENYVPVLGKLERISSPFVGRIQALWKQMRKDIIEIFPEPPGINKQETKKLISIIKDKYNEDAYHSLSIEGYEVTEDLIEKIKTQGWSPDTDPDDLNQKNAMAAKGYYQAFISVLESVGKVLRGNSSGKVFQDDLQAWYRELFSPSVQAGIIQVTDLAGFRNAPVYIKNARHVPPRAEVVFDSMETLFKLLEEEEHPAVRAILGHFIFVYIHPYMDGNGRIARFLLNLMLISGGYNWTVIRTSGRPAYMKALEAASTEGNIRPFTEFVKSELEYWIENNKEESQAPKKSKGST